MPKTTDTLEPGRRVAITQQIPQRDEVWAIRTTGTVVRHEQGKTGSWFARSRDDRFWLDRLVLRKDDGEIVVFNLDQYTHVDMLEEEGQKASALGADQAGHAGLSRRGPDRLAESDAPLNSPSRRPEAPAPRSLQEEKG